MATTVWGVVKEGLIVPASPLPEGARVEIRLTDLQPDLPDNLQAEFDAWNNASNHALALVESLAREGEVDEAR